RLEDVLAEVADAFGAAGAGLGRLHDGLPVVRRRAAADTVPPPLPWGTRPELLTQLARRPTPLPIAGAGEAAWLLTTVSSAGRPAWLLWLEDTPERTWSAGEQAALTLAGNAVARVAAADAAWARLLEQAARQQRLEELVPLIQRLAHDFGNVLTSILGFRELALERANI